MVGFFAVLIPLMIVAVWGAYVIGYDRGEDKRLLKCPHPFCEYLLPAIGAKDEKGNFIIEDCEGCGRRVKFFVTSYGPDRYDRIAEAGK